VRKLKQPFNSQLCHKLFVPKLLKSDIMLQVTISYMGVFFFTFCCIFYHIFCLVFFSEITQKQTLGEVKKTERLFDGKLCQEYSH